MFFMGFFFKKKKSLRGPALTANKLQLFGHDFLQSIKCGSAQTLKVQSLVTYL